jgi:hypothetical protein
MKRALSLALALALTLAVVPAMAGDDETFGSKTPGMFQALRSLSSAEQAALTPLSDDQLAAVEGRNPCADSINTGTGGVLGGGGGVGSCEVTITQNQTATFNQSNTACILGGVCTNAAAAVLTNQVN